MQFYVDCYLGLDISFGDLEAPEVTLQCVGTAMRSRRRRGIAFCVRRDTVHMWAKATLCMFTVQQSVYYYYIHMKLTKG